MFEGNGRLFILTTTNLHENNYFNAVSATRTFQSSLLHFVSNLAILFFYIVYFDRYIL